MKTIITVFGSFALSAIVAAPVQAQIAIPRPPRSGQAVFTYRQCITQAGRIRRQRLRAGHNQAAIDKTWLAQIANCGKLPGAPKDAYRASGR